MTRRPPFDHHATNTVLSRRADLCGMGWAGVRMAEAVREGA